MRIKITNGQSIPIYEQIYNQIKLDILNEKVTAEEQLPSIRGLAKEVKVSVITIKKAYEDLERDGFIYSIPSKGYYVLEQDRESIKKYYEGKISESLSEIKEYANALNLNSSELINFIKSKI